MSYAWFRFYHEFSTDPKIQMLTETDQRRFVMILCLRCCNETVTLHDNQVAFQLRITPEEWLETKKLLMELDLVDDLNQPKNWDKRQFKSDHSKERVEKHRKRYGNAPDPEPDSDTYTEPEKKNGFLHASRLVNGVKYIPSLETCQKLMDITPGWDQNMLIDKYNAWHAGKETPGNPDAAFLGWAKRFTKGQRPR